MTNIQACTATLCGSTQGEKKVVGVLSKSERKSIYFDCNVKHVSIGLLKVFLPEALTVTHLGVNETKLEKRVHDCWYKAGENGRTVLVLSIPDGVSD